MAIVLWVIHDMLMKNRPSESAGKSMVYKRVGIVIQCALLFIATIGTAIFTVLAFNFFDVYLYLGGLFGLVISFVIIQLLYGVEFKNLLKNKFIFAQLVVALKTNFAERKALALLYKLERATLQMSALYREIITLTEEFKEVWSQKST